MTIAADQISYEDLYERWETSWWSASRLDFSEDREQWRSDFTDAEHAAMLRVGGLFFLGEDAVTDGLAPYIDAAPREEQKYLLAAQQADEARTWGFEAVFGRLSEVARELRTDPTPPRLAAGVALYHLVIEAGLAQPGQYFVLRYLEKRDRLPAFREGIERVMQDEHRHIAAGVKLLADLTAEDAEARDAVAELLGDMLPKSTAVMLPENRDLSYLEVLGFTFEETVAYGARAVENALRSAGLPVEELGIATLPPDLSANERARRAVQLLEAGVLGPHTDDPPRDDDHMEAVFDALERSVNPDHGFRTPITLEWAFEDANPWHLVVTPTDARAQRGAAKSPTLTFRCRYADWIDVMAGHEELPRLIARRHVHPKGRWLMLPRLGRLFAS